ncbi:phospholipase A2 inhibitor subunit gamma B-like [Terrapene carolina triunguis]|uniref:phospholipase A2 inhibitor subunit gamma B-like n=1 Tax=Terrapene triunguis TaxID=2587831 RepID=UPI000CEFC352|nr:phospholipase A2 inhibitor subunit gamma B-like [Terrapene carolina triunguis]
MKAFLAICILAALLAMGACLKCEVCERLGKSCTGNLQTCAAGQDSCGVIFEETMQGSEGVNTQNIKWSCVTSSQCKAGHVSVNFGKGMTTRTIVACCMGEACTPALVTVPPADTKPNGRSCPGCYVLNAAQCNEQTIACTGPETQSIDTAGTITMSGNQMQTIMKGCTSESVCAQIEAGSLTFAGISADLTMAKCTAASGQMGLPPATTSSGAVGVAPGPAGPLLPALAGLLLLTLLS